MGWKPVGLVHSSKDTWENMGEKSFIEDVNWVDASVVTNTLTPGRPKNDDPINPYKRFLQAKFEQLAYRHLAHIREDPKKPIFSELIDGEQNNLPEYLLSSTG